MTVNERIKYLRTELLKNKQGKKMTLEEFGDRLSVGKTAISKIETGENNVSDRMIKQISIEFNVSEVWLRDGEGEPFLTMDRDDEIMAAVGKILADEPESFRRRWISVMCRLSPNEWAVLEKICKETFGNNSGNEKD